MPSKDSAQKSESAPYKTQLGKTLRKVRLAEQELVENQSEEPDDLEVGEPPVRKQISKATIVKFIIFGVIILALLGYLAWDIIAKGPLMRLLMNRDELVAAMNSLGPWAPFFYIQLQILQTVVAPIPGQIVGGVGGFLFGNWGILWTTIGSIIGFWLVFAIARKFGRPLLEKIFKKSAIDKFDFIINARGSALIIFAIFLLPGFPDDIVCYIAGLTKLSMKKLMVISILGRFPTIVVTNMIGAGLGDNNLGLVAALSIIGVIIVGIFTWKREAIIKFLKREEKAPRTAAKVLPKTSKNTAKVKAADAKTSTQKKPGKLTK